MRLLVIRRETLRALSSREVARAVGGAETASENAGDVARLPGRPKTGEVVL